MTASGAELAAVRCRGCGGTVRMRAGSKMPTCLFCGADASDLVPVPPPEGIEPPMGALPFAVDDGTARGAFVKFATSSWWYPNDLRSARLELKALLLPAWAWSGEVETHWTGLVRASTRSGKAPVSGAEAVRFEQILVPASRTLRLAELAALGPYDERALGGYDPNGDVPVELSELTRSAARERGQAEMLARHKRAIVADRSLVDGIRASSIATGLDGRPVLVPVWIGAYRYGSRTFRILVNGQSGHLVGEAPRSWRKVVAVAALVIGAIGGVIAAFTVCLGGGGLFAALLGS